MKDIPWCLLGMCVHSECVGDCIDLQENIHAWARSCGVQRSMSNVFLNHSPPFLFFYFLRQDSLAAWYSLIWLKWLSSKLQLSFFFSSPAMVLQECSCPFFTRLRRIKLRSLCLYWRSLFPSLTSHFYW